MSINKLQFYSCDCIISYNTQVNWVQTFKKCRLHKRFDGQLLLQTALDMSHRFERSLGTNTTEEEDQEILLSMEVNRRRIRTENLDNFHEHLPEHHPLSFFQNLKRILRSLNPL